MFYCKPRIEKPVCIKLKKNENLVLLGDSLENAYPLNPGVMLGDNYFGFVLIVEKNGLQEEFVYPTESNISAVGLDKDGVKIYENGKTYSWVFSKSGKEIHSIMGDNISEDVLLERNNFDEAENNDSSRPIVRNPIQIDIEHDISKGKIIVDKNSYSAYPGVMLGSAHYGFIVTVKTKDGIRTITQPTKNRIDAVGADKLGDSIKVYESDKCIPFVVNDSFCTVVHENCLLGEDKVKKIRV